MRRILIFVDPFSRDADELDSAADLLEFITVEDDDTPHSVAGIMAHEADCMAISMAAVGRGLPRPIEAVERAPHRFVLFPIKGKADASTALAGQMLADLAVVADFELRRGEAADAHGALVQATQQGEWDSIAVFGTLDEEILAEISRKTRVTVWREPQAAADATHHGRRAAEREERTGVRLEAYWAAERLVGMLEALGLDEDNRIRVR